MSEQQPLYNFYCVICGTPFTPARAHATTCKMECRVIRASITKKWVEQIPESEKTPINKTEVEAGYKKATGGRDIPKAALAQHKAKEPVKDESAAGKLLGKKSKKNNTPEPVPATKDAAREEPEPETAKKPEAKKK